MRQKILALEKKWVTHCGFYQIFTTVLVICTVDAWYAYKHHLAPQHHHKNVELIPFVNMLVKDLLENKKKNYGVHENEEAMVIGLLCA